MSPRSGVLAAGRGFSWQAYTADDGVECAALVLERRRDGLTGLVRRDLRGWYVAHRNGSRINIPNSVIAELVGTNPPGVRLLEDQVGLAESSGRPLRHLPYTVTCPDCGAEVIAS